VREITVTWAPIIDGKVVPLMRPLTATMKLADGATEEAIRATARWTAADLADFIAEDDEGGYWQELANVLRRAALTA
jgi:hypothetical protein